MSQSNPVTVLTDTECWELLRAQEFGRLAFHLLDEVHIVPLNYAVDQDQRLIFRTAEGSKLLGLTINDDVAFEIDEFDDDSASSVVVRGRARALQGQAAEAIDVLRLRPWLDTAKFNVVAIEVEEVNGRRFALSRPWLHLRRSDADE